MLSSEQFGIDKAVLLAIFPKYDTIIYIVTQKVPTDSRGIDHQQRRRDMMMNDPVHRVSPDWCPVQAVADVLSLAMVIPLAIYMVKKVKQTQLFHPQTPTR